MRAPEFFSNGSKLPVSASADGKLTPEAVQEIATKGEIYIIRSRVRRGNPVLRPETGGGFRLAVQAGGATGVQDAVSGGSMGGDDRKRGVAAQCGACQRLRAIFRGTYGKSPGYGDCFSRAGECGVYSHLRRIEELSRDVRICVSALCRGGNRDAFRGGCTLEKHASRLCRHCARQRRPITNRPQVTNLPDVVPTIFITVRGPEADRGRSEICPTRQDESLVS